MISRKNTTIILGAGHAGMSAAYKLARCARRSIVIEKDNAAGGLSKTLRFNDFRTDIGPHRFFTTNTVIYSVIEGILNKNWSAVNRSTSFYVKGKCFKYPVEFANIVFNLSPGKALAIVSDYLFERLKRITRRSKYNNLEEKLVADFGKSLAKMNMLDYTEKIWGIPSSHISLDWASQRISGLSMSALIKNMLMRSKGRAKTLVDKFQYPDTGAGLIFEKMLDNADVRANTVISTDSYPLAVMHEAGLITKVIIRTPEGKDELDCHGSLVSSIPITTLIKLFSPGVPQTVIDAASRLKFRSHVCLFITLNRATVFKDQWIYFPDKNIPFGRIMEPRNFSVKMSPEGKTSLLLEFFCWENDSIWNAAKKELFDMSIEWLERYGFISRNDVIDTFEHKEKYAYPVYDLDYKENLRIVKDHLAKYKNLISVGRAGLFRYNNQDHAIETGLMAAEDIICGKANVER